MAKVLKQAPLASLQLNFLGGIAALTCTAREHEESGTIRKTDLKFTSEGEANLCPQGGIKLASSEWEHGDWPKINN